MYVEHKNKNNKSTTKKNKRYGDEKEWMKVKNNSKTSMNNKVTEFEHHIY